MESGPWIIVHGIDRPAWPTESGPWTIVHGIACQVWPTEIGPWTTVHGINYDQRKVDHKL